MCPGEDLQRQKHNNLVRETCPVVCILFLKHFQLTNFHLQLWSSSPRWILYWIYEKSGVTKQSTNGIFVIWHRDKEKNKLGSILEKSLYLIIDAARDKKLHGSRSLWERKLCIYSVHAHTKKITWKISRTLWNSMAMRRWTYCYQKSKLVHLVQILWYSTTGKIEFTWWSNKSCFLSENIQNFRNKRISPNKKGLIFLTKCEIQNFPVWLLLQCTY